MGRQWDYGSGAKSLGTPKKIFEELFVCFWSFKILGTNTIFPLAQISHVRLWFILYVLKYFNLTQKQ